MRSRRPSTSNSAGFLKSAGLASIGEATVVSDKKGDYYVARIEKPGRAAADIIAAKRSRAGACIGAV